MWGNLEKESSVERCRQNCLQLVLCARVAEVIFNIHRPNVSANIAAPLQKGAHRREPAEKQRAKMKKKRQKKKK